MECKIAGDKFRRFMVRKGEILLNAGQFVPYQYYVCSGCLRSYFLNESGKDHTIQFAVNNCWISDYSALFTGGLSVLYIECLKDAEIYQLSKESLEMLYLEVPVIETYFRVRMENLFVSFQYRVLSDLSMSAKEKYCWFISKYPFIEQMIKNYHVASFLGITTESLSRIRKELSKEKKLQKLDVLCI